MSVASGAPALVVGIDTEADDQWSEAGRQRLQGTRPGSTSSSPSKNRASSARLRSACRAEPILFHSARIRSASARLTSVVGCAITR